MAAPLQRISISYLKFANLMVDALAERGIQESDVLYVISKIRHAIVNNPEPIDPESRLPSIILMNPLAEGAAPVLLRGLPVVDIKTIQNESDEFHSIENGSQGVSVYVTASGSGAAGNSGGSQGVSNGSGSMGNGGGSIGGSGASSSGGTSAAAAEVAAEQTHIAQRVYKGCKQVRGKLAAVRMIEELRCEPAKGIEYNELPAFKVEVKREVNKEGKMYDLEMVSRVEEDGRAFSVYRDENDDFFIYRNNLRVIVQVKWDETSSFRVRLPGSNVEHKIELKFGNVINSVHILKYSGGRWFYTTGEKRERKTYVTLRHPLPDHDVIVLEDYVI